MGSFLLVFATPVRGVAAPGSPASAPVSPAAPRVAAGKSEEEIQLDGRLDEPAWASAGVIPDLTQQEPHPGEPTPFRTEIRFLVDRDTLYLGILCHDPSPEKIALHTMQRDGDFTGDDTVAFVLDPFGDQRNGYLFRINAAGVRQDGLISQALEVSLDWDGIWDARTQRTESGWTAEIALPARTLRFARGLSEWGLNVERVVARDRLVLRWSGFTHDALLNDLRRAGKLAGVGDLEQGLGLSVSPYGLLRETRDLQADDSASRGAGGVDVTVNVTPELAAVATANTDFAETEVDTRQINLTRFELFFPEKRAFFLEGSNLFDFALGLGTDFIPFFSRQVGLLNGNEVPLDAGAKILGRAGRWGIAALDVVTGSTPSAPGTNLFAGRLNYDLNSHLRLGTLVTRGNPDGVDRNTLGGVDAVWETSTLFGDKNLAFSGWGARSGGEGPPGSRNGWGVRAAYPNDRWDLSAAINQYGEGLNPAMGFLPRPGTRSYIAGIAFQPRPAETSAFRWVRQFFFEIFPTRVDDLNGNPESWRVFVAPFNIETRSGVHLEANVAPYFERLDTPFSIVPGIAIPTGPYRFTRYRVEMESSSHFPLRAGNTVWFGDFFDGRLSQWDTFVEYTTRSGRLQLQATAERDYGRLAEGDFSERLWLLKTTYAFNPYLLLSVFAQYDNACPDILPPGATQCRNLGLNTRLRWTIHPGNDLFVVYDRGWNGLAAAGESASLGPIEDQLTVKLRWTFRR